MGIALIFELMCCSIIYLALLQFIPFVHFPTWNLMVDAETGGCVDRCKEAVFTSSETGDQGDYYICQLAVNNPDGTLSG